MNKLPPLNALRAFETAARHLSFTRAAAELNVTPAAVGHQVRALEDLLRVPLFRRLSRGRAQDERRRRKYQTCSFHFSSPFVESHRKYEKRHRLSRNEGCQKVKLRSPSATKP